MRMYRTVLKKVKSIRHENLRETNAVRVIAQKPAKKRDYLKTQHKLFQRMNVDELYDRAVACLLH